MRARIRVKIELLIWVSIVFVDIGLAQYSMTESFADQSLPVELVSFAAESKGTRVILNWTTASELNNLGFVIERKEIKAEDYHEVANYLRYHELSGRGNSTMLQSYTFVDSVPEVGEYSYRLFQIDNNRKKTQIAEKSLRVNLSIDEHFYVKGIYPNPFNASTVIEFYLPVSSKAELNIYNVIGQKIESLKTGALSMGIQRIRWAPLGQPTGLYYLIIRYQDEQIVKRVLYLK